MSYTFLTQQWLALKDAIQDNKSLKNSISVFQNMAAWFGAKPADETTNI